MAIAENSCKFGCLTLILQDFHMPVFYNLNQWTKPIIYEENLLSKQFFKHVDTQMWPLMSRFCIFNIKIFQPEYLSYFWRKHLRHANLKATCLAAETSWNVKFDCNG